MQLISFTDFNKINKILESKKLLNEGILNKDFTKSLGLITSYLSKKLEKKVIFSEHTQEVENTNGHLTTCFIAFGDKGELIRLEWDKNSNSSNLYSFSYFNGSQNIPIRNIIIQNNSLALVLPAIIKVIKDPKVSISELNLVKPEEGEILKESKKIMINEDRYNDLLRMGKGRSKEEEVEYLELAQDKFGDKLNTLPDYANNFKKETKSLIAKFKDGQISKTELIQSVSILEAEQKLESLLEDKTKSEKFNLINPDDEDGSYLNLTREELFKQIDMFTALVGSGKRNAFLLTGMGGLGKTYNVEKTLKEIGLEEKIDWFKVSGAAGTGKVYQALFKNNGKLTVFDDCDSVLRDEDCVNLFKAALDTGKKREISYNKQGYFDPKDFDFDTEDEGYVNLVMDGKFPASFEFTGQVIFISNWDMKKIPQPMQTRCAKLDLQLTANEVKDHVQSLLPHIAKEDNFDMSIKEYMLDCLSELMDEKRIKYMTIRDFVVGLPSVELWIKLNYPKQRIKALIYRTVIGPQ